MTEYRRLKTPLRTVVWSDDSDQRRRQLVSREWLVAGGNGSYACGTLGFVSTRRHHGLLIANLPAPQGRTLSLSQLRDAIVDETGAPVARFWGAETADGALTIHGGRHLDEFFVDCGFPTWTYRIGDAVIRKSLVMPYRSKTICVRYSMLEGDRPAQLQLRPMIQFRGHNDSVATGGSARCVQLSDSRFEFASEQDLHRLLMHLSGGSFQEDPFTQRNCYYRVEADRGYDHVGDLHSPGCFEATLSVDQPVVVIASMDGWHDVDHHATTRLFDAERRRRQELIAGVDIASNDAIAAELVLAADQFLIEPAPRQADHPDSDPTTEEAPRRSVIAGYPWFTDWGRDTMISLPGLALATNRPGEARRILLTFADYIRDGLIPNWFPEGGQEGYYNTADATLWFFQAIHQYESTTGDRELARQLLPKLALIVEAHLQGTRFGIHVDPRDDLLVQGQRDVQLTWMDAKAGEWVVTPRRGKAVEINALWYNALRLYCDWLEKCEPASEVGRLRPQLQRLRNSFNQKFWFGKGGYLYDVVEGEQGNDASLRPNQLFAISLQHPVLDESRWPSVLECVKAHLLTPVGLRSLARKDEAYLGEYTGDVYQRDAAYHQGTVWSWLIGPWVKAWRRTFPDRCNEASTWTAGLEEHLGEACIGQISEIFSGDPPHEPKGCFAQAWGVAELLEARRLLASQKRPRPPVP